eukprot:15439625-Alexandrium_andersonii.AAC.1
MELLLSRAWLSEDLAHEKGMVETLRQRHPPRQRRKGDEVEREREREREMEKERCRDACGGEGRDRERGRESCLLYTSDAADDM